MVVYGVKLQLRRYWWARIQGTLRMSKARRRQEQNLSRTIWPKIVTSGIPDGGRTLLTGQSQSLVPSESAVQLNTGMFASHSPAAT